MFKSITGFEEVDVNLLEGVHTTYNSLSSRFEIAPDDNRNISYPFEYCWNKSNEGKELKPDEEEDDSDEFDEMWVHSQNTKVDLAADFGNELKLEDNKVLVDTTGANFGNTLDVIPKAPGDISSIDKKS